MAPLIYYIHQGSRDIALNERKVPAAPRYFPTCSPAPAAIRQLTLGVEDFPVEQFVGQCSVEGVTVAILLGAARFDIGGLGSDGRNPFPKCRCQELWAVIGTDVCWKPVQYE
jgi:hypothetical protein